MQSDRIDPPLPFSNPRHEALIGVWWTGMQLKRRSRAFFASIGTTEADFHLLMVLRHVAPPLTQKDLSARLLVDKANMTPRIDRLEADGLLRRRDVPDDRRSHHIELTAKGRRRLDRLEAAYVDLVGRATSKLTAAESRELTRLTRKLREGLVGL